MAIKGYTLDFYKAELKVLWIIVIFRDLCKMPNFSWFNVKKGGFFVKVSFN